MFLETRERRRRQAAVSLKSTTLNMDIYRYTANKRYAKYLDEEKRRNTRKSGKYLILTNASKKASIQAS